MGIFSTLHNGLLYVLPILIALVLMIFSAAFMASRFRRCPADKILVVSGKVGPGESYRCIRGGGTFVMPMIQEADYLSLAPIAGEISLRSAPAQDGEPVDATCSFVVGISVEPAILRNAVERLLHASAGEIKALAREIVSSQLRKAVASLSAGQIDRNRENLTEAAQNLIDPELNKIGLFLINASLSEVAGAAGFGEPALKGT